MKRPAFISRWLAVLMIMAMAGWAGAQPPPEPPLDNPPGDVVINLAEKGLEPGDLIDPYIEKYFKDGHQVRVPGGTYKWNLARIGPAENASFIGEGMVVLDATERLDEMALINLTSDTRMEVRNVTVRGAATGRGAIARLWANTPEAVVIARNIRLPDGACRDVSNSRSGMFVSRNSQGQVWVIDCHIEGFSDNGLYGSAPNVARGRNGVVHVRRGLFKNNNISGVRIASSGSSVIGAVVVNDAPAPPYGPSGARNQRGIWVLLGRDNIWIEDCDVTHTLSGGGAVMISAHRSLPATGTIRGLRVRHEGSSPAVNITGGEWTGGDIDLTGEGNLAIGEGDFENVRRGEEAAPPRTEPRPVVTGW